MTGFVSHVAGQHLHEVMCGGPEGTEGGADERGEVAVLDGGNTLAITALDPERWQGGPSARTWTHGD